MIKKRLKDCDFIFLDSGVIIDLLKIDLSASSADVVARIEQIRKFFNTLNSNVFTDKKTVYQLSAISIAEIFHLDGDQDTTVNAIASAFDSQEVEIYAFDQYSAISHNKDFHDLLGNKGIAQLRQSVSYPTSVYASINERIRKDMLIAATAKLYKSDVVLTNDSGFQQLCDRLDIASHLFTGNPADFSTSQDGNTIYDFA